MGSQLSVSVSQNGVEPLRYSSLRATDWLNAVRLPAGVLVARRVFHPDTTDTPLLEFSSSNY